MQYDTPQSIACFSGHMFDAVDRPTPRFPQDMALAAYSDIEASLYRNNVRLGYSSLAAGADMIFVTAMLGQRKPVRLIIPGPLDRHVETSVSPTGVQAVEQFHELYSSCEDVTPPALARGYWEPQDVNIFSACNRLMQELTMEEARGSLTGAIMIALCGNDTSILAGGTGDAVRSWRERHLAVDLIEPRLY
jgi:hypothetical protein